jgi:serine/threonine protein kinase
MFPESTPPLMTSQTSELLARWRQLRQQGQSVTPEELCHDCPELLASLRPLLDDLPPLTPAMMRQQLGPPQVAGYEILGELGRGGMGVVFRARHMRLNRIVALKMILGGSLAGPEELIRFRTEAEAVARLQHPNIVQIHEIGEHQGQPYFSLEFCAAGSLATHIRGIVLPPLEAARLVETLARAMQVAHQHDIVHRDLKPANVLLVYRPGALGQRPGSNTEVPTERLKPESRGSNPDNQWPAAVKISDFGLAKRLDNDASQTQTGAVLGTPSYMAPEQARGALKEVGPHTDIYALGALLYELLTTRPPFLAAAVVDTLNLVEHQDPVPPSQLQPKIPRDLETICLKCLQKEPARRYANAEALAEDLRRFQAGEPIVARPVGRLERAWKWTKRRPAVTALSAALLLAVVIGFALVTWKWQEETAARHLAESREREADKARENEKLARTDAEKQRKEADRQKQQALEKSEITLRYFGRAQDAVKKLMTEASNDTLKNEPRFEQVRKALLEKALAYYQEFLHEQSDDPTLRLTTAAAFRDVGDIHQQLGSKQKAKDAYLTSVKMLQALKHEFPKVPEYRQDLAMSCNNLGVLLRATGQAADAEKLHREAYDLRKQLVKDFPTVAAYRADLARSCNNLGVLLWDRQEIQEAEKLYREARDHYQALAAADLLHTLVTGFPGVEAYRQDLAMSCNNLAVLLEKTNHFGAAEELHRQAYQLRRRLVDGSPTMAAYRQDLATTCNNLGNLLLRSGAEPLEAEKLYREASELYQQLVKDFPSVAAYREDLAMSCSNLAMLLENTDRLVDAAKLHRQAYELRKQLVKEFTTVAAYAKDLAQSSKNLAVCCVELGQHAGAARALETLAKLPDQDAESLHAAAVLLARCVLLAAKDSALSRSQRQQLTIGYVEQAITVLKHAIANGFRDVGDLKANPVFAPLRQHEGFQALIRGLPDGK